MAISNKKTPSLSEEDVEAMKSIVDVLRPVERTSQLLESRSECISSVLPAYYAMRTSLALNTPAVSEVDHFREEIKNGLEKHWRTSSMLSIWCWRHAWTLATSCRFTHQASGQWSK